MPITVEIVDSLVTEEVFQKVYSYFEYIDNKFSTFKKTSEITMINEGKIHEKNYSKDMRTVMKLSEQTRKQTNGYFDINRNGKLDPSGLVKGWAIHNASRLLLKEGYDNFYIDAGGDIQTSGENAQNKSWRVGIRNPFNDNQIVKVLYIHNEGVATSGTYFRGRHICNPKESYRKIDEIVSLTVISPNVYESDRSATAAFAMGKNGIKFIENLKGYEGYMIDKSGIVSFTINFNKYTQPS